MSTNLVPTQSPLIRTIKLTISLHLFNKKKRGMSEENVKEMTFYMCLNGVIRKRSEKINLKNKSFICLMSLQMKENEIYIFIK